MVLSFTIAETDSVYDEYFDDIFFLAKYITVIFFFMFRTGVIVIIIIIDLSPTGLYTY